MFVICHFSVVVSCGQLGTPSNGHVNTSVGTSVGDVARYLASRTSPYPQRLRLLRNHGRKGLVRLDKFSCIMQECVQANQIAG